MNDKDADADIVVAGVLKKRAKLINRWAERYFVLRGHTLYYYATAADTVSIGSISNDCILWQQ